MGIMYAVDIMNFVILTALLSLANSGLYAHFPDVVVDVQGRNGTRVSLS